MKKSYPAAGGRDRAACAWFRCLLIVPMLLFGLSGTEAAAQTQPLRVSVQAQDEVISEVFRSIREQTGYSFVYNNSDGRRRAASRSTSQTDAAGRAGQTLRRFGHRLHDQGQTHHPLEKIRSAAVLRLRGGGISGSVRDAEGVGLIGASVIIKGHDDRRGRRCGRQLRPAAGQAGRHTPSSR